MEICWIPAHVGISGNEEADRAAKSAIMMTLSDIKIPISDYTPVIKSKLIDKWQDIWSNVTENKLKEIKSTVSFWPTSIQKERQTSVILCRLRIGHTRLTHGYLMTTPHEPLPICGKCNTLITVKHVFYECPDFQEHRRICFGNRSFKEILSESPNFNINSIIRFLKRCNLLDKI